MWCYTQVRPLAMCGISVMESQACGKRVIITFAIATRLCVLGTVLCFGLDKRLVEIPTADAALTSCCRKWGCARKQLAHGRNPS